MSFLSMLGVAYGLLFLVGVIFGSLRFIGGFRSLPRWIRIALLMIGLSFCGSAIFAVGLDCVAPLLSPAMHRFLFAHQMIIFGVGIGIILLLICRANISKPWGNSVMHAGNV